MFHLARMLAARFTVVRALTIAASLVRPKPIGILYFLSALISFTTHLPVRSCATCQLAGRGMAGGFDALEAGAEEA